MTHFASASAGRQSSQTRHLCDFFVTAAAVISLLDLLTQTKQRRKKMRNDRWTFTQKEKEKSLFFDTSTGTVYNSQSITYFIF
jgi:hypothetical protein